MAYEFSNKKTGNRIKARRIELGMSQEEAAEMLGYTQSKMSRMENGVGTNDLENLKVIAAGFDCSLEMLVFGITQEEVVKMTAGEVKCKDDAVLCKDKDIKENAVKAVDTKGEVLESLRGVIHEPDVLNLGEENDVTPWSVLAQIRSADDPEHFADMAAAMCFTDRSGDDAFWNQGAANLLSFLLLYASAHEDVNVFDILYKLRVSLRKRSNVFRFCAKLPLELRGKYLAFAKDRNAEWILSLVEYRLRERKL